MRIQPPVNPAKELARLDALRRAKLGTLYGKFWVAPGVRSPSEFNDEGLWDPLPPKKPPESVRFASEEERLKKAVGAELTVPRRLQTIASPSQMAATASAYRKPPQSTSENSSVESPFELLPRAEASALHPRDRMVLVTLLKLGNRFAVKGSPNQIFPSALTVAVELGIPTITVRRSIRRMNQKLKLLHLVHHENWIDEHGEIRRPRTYQVDEEKLPPPRMTLREHRARRFRTRQQQKSRHSSTAPEPAAPASTPTPQAAAPVPVAPSKSAYHVPNATEHAARFEEVRRGGDAHRSTERKLRQLRASDGKRLVAKILQLHKGSDSYESAEGFQVQYPPGHPSIRPPMSMKNALIAACLEFGLPHDPAKEYAEQCGLKFDEPSP